VSLDLGRREGRVFFHEDFKKADPGIHPAHIQLLDKGFDYSGPGKIDA
jgi:hypothetical protein